MRVKKIDKIYRHFIRPDDDRWRTALHSVDRGHCECASLNRTFHSNRTPGPAKSFKHWVFWLINISFIAATMRRTHQSVERISKSPSNVQFVFKKFCRWALRSRDRSCWRNWMANSVSINCAGASKSGTNQRAIRIRNRVNCPLDGSTAQPLMFTQSKMQRFRVPLHLRSVNELTHKTHFAVSHNDTHPFCKRWITHKIRIASSNRHQ